MGCLHGRDMPNQPAVLSERETLLKHCIRNSVAFFVCIFGWYV